MDDLALPSCLWPCKFLHSPFFFLRIYMKDTISCMPFALIVTNYTNIVHVNFFIFSPIQ